MSEVTPRMAQPCPGNGVGGESTSRDQLVLMYRAVVDLMDYQGYTAQQAADTLHLALGTLKTRVRQGLAQVRTLFGQDIYHARRGYSQVGG